MIYADTSFILALYLSRDRFHRSATKIAARLQEPIPLTLLGELELLNGVRRTLAAKIIDRAVHDAIFRQIADDETEGVLVRRAIDTTEHYGRARELSRKFTPHLSARSLDILHVASALLLKAEPFVSFDAKQKLLAEKAGLRVLTGLGKT